MIIKMIQNFVRIILIHTPCSKLKLIKSEEARFTPRAYLIILGVMFEALIMLARHCFRWEMTPELHMYANLSFNLIKCMFE